MRLAELRRAKAQAEADAPSEWYCTRLTCDGLAHDGWVIPHARTEQRPPPGAWTTWLFIAGRGAGKSTSGAEWVIDQVRHGKRRIALVGRTPADVRKVMIEGESGILARSPAGNRPEYAPSRRELWWPNGARAHTYSAEVPAELRGPAHDAAWCDETSSWTDAGKGDVVDTAWNNLMLGLRLGPDPRCVVTTTPKPNALTKTLLGRATTATTTGTTYDNLHNLAPTFRDSILASYEGTRLGRQELMGELLADVEGALWDGAAIEATRVDVAPSLSRIVVGVDPSGSARGDEVGIVVAGIDAAGHIFVLADRSGHMSPAGWGAAAVGAYRAFAADRIVVETNFGGDMATDTIRHVDASVAVSAVHASRGKVVRAEPISALWERAMAHMVGTHPQLEDQMATMIPGETTDGAHWDRADAMVWAVTELAGIGGAAGRFLAALAG